MTDAGPPGGQAERTLLAWRRTCLAVALGNAIAVRYTLWVGSPAVLVIAVVGLGLSLVAAVLVQRRYHRTRRGLESGALHEVGALSLAATASATVLLGLGALLLVAAVWGPS